MDAGKFIAHVAVVTQSSQVLDVLRNLKSDHKIAKATHNIVAYRIRMEDGRLVYEFLLNGIKMKF